MSILLEIKRRHPDYWPMQCTGWDDCIIGYTYDEARTMRLIYSIRLMIKKLIKEDGMTDQEARDYLVANVLDSYIGKNAPILCIDDIDNNYLKN